MFRGSSRSKDRARFVTLVPSTDVSGHFLDLKVLFGASHHRARAGLEPRIGRPPCSPASGDPCVVHTNNEPATAETTGGPRKDAARARTDAGLGDTTASVREQPPAARPWAPKRRGRGAGRSELGVGGWACSSAQPCSARPARPHSGVGRPEFMDGRREPCNVCRRRHMAIITRGGKTGKCGSRIPRGAPLLSLPRAVPQADETFGSPHSF